MMIIQIFDISMKRSQPILFFIFFVFFLQLKPDIFCQVPSLLLKQWIKKLEAKNGDSNLPEISQQFNSNDSIFVDAAIRELENHKSVNPYYNTRLLLLKANQIYRFHYVDQKILIQQYYKQAFKEVYTTGDEYFISTVCEGYASLMYAFQEIDLAASYYLQAEEINEHLENKIKNPGKA